MAPEVGFEPTTNRLTADRSTTELLRILPVGGQRSYGDTRFKRITSTRRRNRLLKAQKFDSISSEIIKPPPI
jgi:hypothetical protein